MSSLMRQSFVRASCIHDARSGFLLALLMLVFASHARAAPAPRVAPAFSLATRGGSVVSDSLRGRVVVLDFWASWCVPCRKSIPWLASLQGRYRERGLVVVGVNLDKDRALADEFLRSYEVPFTIAFDPAGKSAAAYGVKGMPSTYLIARDGTLLESHTGYTPDKAAAFERRIEEAMAP